MASADPSDSASHSDRPAGNVKGLRARVDRWLDSDLIGIPATAYTFFVLAASFLVFRIGGGVAGMIVGVALWIPMVVFAVRGTGRRPLRLDLARPVPGPLHRVLIVANRGLDDPALCAEVCRRSDRTVTEAMIVAPVTAASRLAELSDDVDAEQRAAEGRLQRALATLRSEGVQASGRTDISQPMESLLDGLREFPANEILMVPDREADWSSAAELAERARTEVGLPVTTLDAVASGR